MKACAAQHAQRSMRPAECTKVNAAVLKILQQLPNEYRFQ